MIDDTLELGPCCACDATAGVTAIIMLPHKNAVPSRGWGCMTCGLPCDGATAVLCGSCAEDYAAGMAKLTEVCRGWPGEDGREPIETAKARGAHDHNMAYHPGEVWQ